MADIERRLESIENKVTQILNIVSEKSTMAESKWLTEPQVMAMLNVSKRGIDDIRRKNLIRTSSATGRNFLFYKNDVETYIHDYSDVKKRSSKPKK